MRRSRALRCKRPKIFAERDVEIRGARKIIEGYDPKSFPEGDGSAGAVDCGSALAGRASQPDQGREASARVLDHPLAGRKDLHRHPPLDVMPKGGAYRRDGAARGAGGGCARVLQAAEGLQARSMADH